MYIPKASQVLGDIPVESTLAMDSTKLPQPMSIEEMKRECHFPAPRSAILKLSFQSSGTGGICN